LKDSDRDIKSIFGEEISKAQSTKDLDLLRIKYLGRHGIVRDLMRDVCHSLPSERPKIGKRINRLKQEIAAAIDVQYQKLKERELSQRLCQERKDITLPGRCSFMGRKHPLTQMIDEFVAVSIGMGFSIQYSPEIESEYYNYGGLNYPLDHPARDMQDTFYITSDTLLRTHTTAIQQHIMENNSPPIRVVALGKCYRNETVSMRSHIIFHQIDVVYIDKGVSFANLLATIEEFYTKIFHQKIEMRVRPSYFPFVEPGMEVDIRCTHCTGNGCSVCKNTGWLEVCGAGMIHPEVLKNGGLDPDIYSGYAWGGGVERPFMLLHGVNDIRLFLENDFRFLSQFP